MIRTNLASRPFYDDRPFRIAVAVVAALLAAVTIYNAVALVRLTAAHGRLGAHAAEAEQEAARLRRQAGELRTRIDPREVEAVAAAAREANRLIDQRTFSWTGLLARLESTLPADVRIKAVQPRVDKGVFQVVIAAEARRIEELEWFMEQLEATGAFSAVKPIEETRTEDGVIDVVLEGVYRDAAGETAR